MSKMNIGTAPPLKKCSSPVNEIVEEALRNRGQWVSMPVDEITTTHYSSIYRKVAQVLGVSVRHVGDTLYVFVPES